MECRGSAEQSGAEAAGTRSVWPPRDGGSPWARTQFPTASQNASRCLLTERPWVAERWRSQPRTSTRFTSRGSWSSRVRLRPVPLLIKELCERADEEEQATGQPSFPWQWLDREKRLPARMGDYLQPKKYHSEFGAWMAEDAIPQLEQLCGGPVRHNRFHMLASGGGQPYLQH